MTVFIREARVVGKFHNFTNMKRTTNDDDDDYYYYINTCFIQVIPATGFHFLPDHPVAYIVNPKTERGGWLVSFPENPLNS